MQDVCSSLKEETGKINEVSVPSRYLVYFYQGNRRVVRPAEGRNLPPAARSPPYPEDTATAPVARFPDPRTQAQSFKRLFREASSTAACISENGEVPNRLPGMRERTPAKCSRNARPVFAFCLPAPADKTSATRLILGSGFPGRDALGMLWCARLWKDDRTGRVRDKTGMWSVIRS